MEMTDCKAIYVGLKISMSQKLARSYSETKTGTIAYLRCARVPVRHSEKYCHRSHPQMHHL